MSLISSAFRPTEIAIVVVLIALLLLLPPLSGTWLAIDAPWYPPYLAWFGINLLSCWMQCLLRKHAV